MTTTTEDSQPSLPPLSASHGSAVAPSASGWRWSIRKRLVVIVSAAAGAMLAFVLSYPQVMQLYQPYYKFLGRMWIWELLRSRAQPRIVMDYFEMPIEIGVIIVSAACLISLICGFCPRWPRDGGAR